jgi:hypothetical protein
MTTMAGTTVTETSSTVMVTGTTATEAVRRAR